MCSPVCNSGPRSLKISYTQQGTPKLESNHDWDISVDLVTTNKERRIGTDQSLYSIQRNGGTSCQHVAFMFLSRQTGGAYRGPFSGIVTIDQKHLFFILAWTAECIITLNIKLSIMITLFIVDWHRMAAFEWYNYSFIASRPRLQKEFRMQRPVKQSAWCYQTKLLSERRDYSTVSACIKMEPLCPSNQ